MALVNAGFECSVLLGAKNDKTRVIRLKGDATLTTYDLTVTALVAFLTDLGAVSAGKVKSYTITGRAIEDAYTRPSDSDAESRDTALVVVGIDGEPLKSANVQIPMPKIGIFRAADTALMDEIDFTDADLIAYLDNFKSAGKFTLSDNEKANDVIISGRRLK